MPIDPCGLPVDLATGQGWVTMAFWRDDPRRQRVAVYRVPRNRPFVPGLKTFLLGCLRDQKIKYSIPPGGVGDDDRSFVGAFGWAPPFEKVGNHYCGSPAQWLEGSTAADPSLEWTPLGFSTCCEGVLPVGTPNRLAMFGPGGLSVVDSLAFDDGAGTLIIDGGVDLLNLLVMRQTALGPVRASWSALQVLGKDLSFWWLGGLPTDDATAGVRLAFGGHKLVHDLVPDEPGNEAVYAVDGAEGVTIIGDGWDVRGGIVLAVPSPGDLITSLGLGSAAFTSSSAYDAAGLASAAYTAAASDLAAHVAAANPHPQYLLSAAGTWLVKASNLSDLPSPSTARTNLGLTASATLAPTNWLQTALNLSDLPGVSAARTNLGLGAAATMPVATWLVVVNDLADLNSPTAARGNLGLGSAAVLPSTAFLASGGTDVVANLAANQALTQNAHNVLTGWTESTDALGEFNPTTGVFAPAVTGRYLVTFGSAIGGAAGRCIATIRNTTPADVRVVADGTLVFAGGITQVTLTAGTSYTFNVFPTAAGTSALGGAASTFLAIRRQM